MGTVVRRPNPRPIRGVLSVPPLHAHGVSEKVAGASAVPTDAHDLGDAWYVDFVRLPGRLWQGTTRTAADARLRAALRPGIVVCGAASDGRAAVASGNPSGHFCACRPAEV